MIMKKHSTSILKHMDTKFHISRKHTPKLKKNYVMYVYLWKM